MSILPYDIDIFFISKESSISPLYPSLNSCLECLYRLYSRFSLYCYLAPCFCYYLPAIQVALLYFLNSFLDEKCCACICRIEYQLPNLIVGAITKESLYNAFENGIAAEQASVDF